MSKELISEIKLFIEDGKYDLLYKALLNEIAYYYDYIKSDYTDFENIDLTLEDFKNITNEIIGSYHMNEGLNEMIENKLYDYIGGK